jgi:Cof subfamily protein (haloacid dehalogenase superfamily)
MNMIIKMIVTDLDGTLLRDDKTISEKCLQALRQCRDIGIKIVYATGRSSSASRIVPKELFDGYIINNGAVGVIGKEIVYSRLMPYETTRSLLLSCDKRGLNVASQLSGMDYGNFDVGSVWEWVKNFTVVNFAEHEKDGEKIYIENCNLTDAAFVEQILPEDLYLTVSRDMLGQIMHKEATKSNAVFALADYWNINQPEIVAFGDDLNDIDLLRAAGIGVAMGNALDEVKASASQVCLSNEEDGLAFWIEDNILSNHSKK